MHQGLQYPPAGTTSFVSSKCSNNDVGLECEENLASLNVFGPFHGQVSDSEAATPCGLFFTRVPLTPTCPAPSHSAIRLAEEDDEHDRTLHEQEVFSMPAATFVQHLYSGSMPATERSSLVDWMVDVALQLQLSTDALFLAVQLMDKHMEWQQQQQQQQVQGKGDGSLSQNSHLKALTALWVAAKYEEASVPPAAAFLKQLPSSCSSCTIQDFQEAEAVLLTAVDHRLALPTPKTFLRRYLFKVAVDRRLYFMSGYLAELALLDGGMLCYLPSTIAASAYVWALALTGHTCNDQHLNQLTGYRLEQILPCLLRLARVHTAACNTPQPCIISCKYLSGSVEAVAAVPPLSSDEVAQLAVQQEALLEGAPGAASAQC